MPENNYRVVIDAGHGGKEPGATWYNLKESDINLSIAKRAAARLSLQNVTSILTRNSDEYLSIDARPAKANAINADLFVSIHCNAFNETSHGTEVVTYLTPTAEDDRLSTAILNQLIKAIGTTNRGIKRQDIGVCRGAIMPSCLVECAFLSNPKEAELLASSEGQEVIAEAIAKGICEYLGLLYEPAGVTVYVDGRRVDYEARLIDGKTFVHVRFAEAVGYDVTWEGATASVMLNKK